MTTRELQITKAVLDYLHSLDGGQATELQIHAAVNQEPPGATPPASAHELAAALRQADAEGWLNGVPTRFNRRLMKWNITDAGEGARLEM